VSINIRSPKGHPLSTLSDDNNAYSSEISLIFLYVKLLIYFKCGALGNIPSDKNLDGKR